MFSFSFHSFISLFALLFSLFVSCTGLPLLKLPSTKIHSSTKLLTLICIVGKNVLFLAFSTILCNLIGTLAASVLLFPSFLSQNSSRLNHLNNQRFLIIFFIIIIGNCAGVLSPLGDPPLYMGYTNGVEFKFTFIYLYKIFLVANVYILIIFAFIDLFNAWIYRREQKHHKNRTYELTSSGEKFDERYDLSSAVRIQWNGIYHGVFLVLIIGTVLLKGFNIPLKWPEYVQEIILFIIAIVCICFDVVWTKQTLKQWWKSNYSTRIEPVAEVIVIFVGLFFTMSAPITILSNLNLQFGPKLLFLLSGIFAALLDNAPVYISFAASAAARHNITVDTTDFLATFFAEHETDAIITIRAISAGSVLMGACTLLGNAPNMIIALMATRYTYRLENSMNKSEDEDIPIYRLENVGFIRFMITSCLILTPIFVVIDLFML
ncbi:hypothetical protein I4U23_011910 [Adineta vaga]|nr:hypothetical protein I4U23_011910 [Adineta vaga]